MSDVLLGALIGAVGIVLAASVGLIPLAWRIRKDRKDRVEETKRKAAHDLEQIRENRRRAAAVYRGLLGTVTASLEALSVDANNADQLLNNAESMFLELQRYGQSEIPFAFGQESAIVWTERANRHILRLALDLARSSRASHDTGEAARATEAKIRDYTLGHVDMEARAVFDVEAQAAVDRSPEVVASFVSPSDHIKDLASLAKLPLPAAFSATPQTAGH